MVSTHPFYKFPSAATTPVSPKTISGLALWIDAADSSSILVPSGTAVTKWFDKLTGSVYFAPNSISPNISTATGYPSILIANTASINQSLTTSASVNYLSDGKFAGFVVVTFTNTSIPNIIQENASSKFNIAANNNYILTVGTISVDSGTTYGSTSAAGVILGFTYDQSLSSGSRTVTYTNGLKAVTGGTNSDTTLSSTITLQTPSGSTSSLHYHEIILYSSVPTTVQRQQIEGYLAWKWGLQTKLQTSHPYYKIRP
jgi:hypothetical protein